MYRIPTTSAAVYQFYSAGPDGLFGKFVAPLRFMALLRSRVQVMRVLALREKPYAVYIPMLVTYRMKIYHELFRGVKLDEIMGD